MYLCIVCNLGLEKKTDTQAKKVFAMSTSEGRLPEYTREGERKREREKENE